jgi:hypothetical protein
MLDTIASYDWGWLTVGRKSNAPVGTADMKTAPVSESRFRSISQTPLLPNERYGSSCSLGKMYAQPVWLISQATSQFPASLYVQPAANRLPPAGRFQSGYRTKDGRGRWRHQG